MLRFMAWRMRRATGFLLNSLDDHALQDIGLRRCDIDATVGAIDWPAALPKPHSSICRKEGIP